MASHAAFKPKKVLYFVSGAAMNAQEKAQLAYLNGSVSPVYNVAVRTIVGSLSYGGTSKTSHHDFAQAELCDFVAYSDAAAAVLGADPILSPYLTALLAVPGVSLLTIPLGNGAAGMIISPATVSFNHLATLQLAAVIKKQDGTLQDVTTDAATTWSVTSGAGFSVGAHTGIVSASGAGTGVIGASYAPAGSSTSSANSGTITAT